MADIIEWSERTARHLDGIDKQTFEQNQILQDAVVRCLEVIGEAAHHVVQADAGVAIAFPSFKQAYWTRNRIAHGYFDVDPAVVWATATVSIPSLIRDVRRMLGDRGP